MTQKLPILLEIAEEYEIDPYLTTSFLKSSPSQNYALIHYLIETNQPLVIHQKINPIFGKQSSQLKRNYQIDIKDLMIQYPYKKGRAKEGEKKNGI